MATKYTSGPWSVSQYDRYSIVGPTGGETVAEASDMAGDETGEVTAANASLIAAAPDLVVALLWALRFANTASMHDPEWTESDVASFDAARAALVKAGVTE